MLAEYVRVVLFLEGEMPVEELKRRVYEQFKLTLSNDVLRRIKGIEVLNDKVKLTNYGLYLLYLFVKREQESSVGKLVLDYIRKQYNYKLRSSALAKLRKLARI